MKIQYVDDDAYARIWITGPFWQLRRAKKLFEAGKEAAPVNSLASYGITFQLTLLGSRKHALRAYKAVVAESVRSA